MTKWEYALLVRRRMARVDAAGWEVTFHWYGPDGSMLDVSPFGETALAHLNRAGEQGWELVSVSENPSLEGTSELHRYHLKRTAPVPAPRARLGGGSRGVRRPRD
ncbi:hypothetical protein SAMN05421812_12160 [Asanoa hainanensis]|uniref:DUF4177 domain-containing protein n=1 Tax=Asanoa hainanensis TaxID=560556 RepID=A0A239PE70_9ACTN|nr:hypothetical protein [Asanoa hainanensis]SNT65292.1 hypothetical protein SAMN05421812_12160 [Asanoa hainanensis]